MRYYTLKVIVSHTFCIVEDKVVLHNTKCMGKPVEDKVVLHNTKCMGKP